MNRAVGLTPRFLSLALVGLFSAGCAEPAKETDSGSGGIPDGRALYLAKCAKCHKFYDPARYSESEWQKWMVKMSKKAKLKPDQEAILAHYIDTTLRTPQKTNSPAR
jgi:mono/diheme cytochrome c family protein